MTLRSWLIALVLVGCAPEARPESAPPPVAREPAAGPFLGEKRVSLDAWLAPPSGER